jgi:hypothetical protein
MTTMRSMLSHCSRNEETQNVAGELARRGFLVGRLPSGRISKFLLRQVPEKEHGLIAERFYVVGFREYQVMSINNGPCSDSCFCRGLPAYEKH